MAPINTSALESIAAKLVDPGRGILAADESTPTIGKRFTMIDLESTEEHRRAYRDMLFTTPNVGEFISGVILYDETLRQKISDGTPIPAALEARNMVPGIKVDTGAKDLASCPGEKVTEGLDGLRGRLEEYHGLGARFAKWRAVINIGDGLPSRHCLRVNAHALARYAALCQEAEIVPIVEPEVIMDGGHSIERCYEVTEHALRHLFGELFEQGVHLEGTLLKPNMVISGTECPQQASPAEVAEQTVRCLTRNVPASIPGIVFLSGGQSDQDATHHLSLMNAMGDHPWELSFSYGRALQHPALMAWGGKPENVEKAQKVFHHRSRMNSEARYGRYETKMEREVAA